MKTKLIHFQRSRMTWNFENGDRVRYGCEMKPSWHKKDTFSTSKNKVTCPQCCLFLNTKYKPRTNKPLKNVYTFSEVKSL